VLNLDEAGPVGDWLHGLSAVERGNLAHRALEIIGRRGMTDGAVDDALELLTASHDFRLESEDMDRLRDCLRWYLRDAQVEGEPLYEAWIAQAARLRAESQFVAPLAGVRIEGTIDAVVEGADGELRLVDYKTGLRARDKMDTYRFQVGLYCAAVEAITGRMPAGAAVVLLDQGEVQQLDPAAEASRALTSVGEITDAIRDGAFRAESDCNRAGCSLAYACELA
jgi:RecB family exonuclease